MQNIVLKAWNFQWKKGNEKDGILNDRKFSAGENDLRDRVESSVWVLHPLEPIHLGWDALVSVVMLYVIIVVPIKICFQLNLPLYSSWSLIDLTVDAIFMSDILVTFNTGYFLRRKIVTSRWKIAKKYLMGWFFLDVVTSIPFEWVIDAFHSGLGHYSKIAWLLKIARIARMLKILRLAKLLSNMSQWEQSSAYWTTAIRAAKFLALVFLAAHVAACCLMGIANMYRGPDRTFENYYGYNENTWLVRFDDTWNKRPAEQYLRALYWAFTTLATVGYGDITPLLPYEIMFTIFVEIAGSSLFGYIIGNVASLITRDDETHLMIKQKIQSVSQYIRHREFPDEIAAKIKRHFEYSWRQNQVSKEHEIMSDMPHALRAECALFVHRTIIQRVPFLSELGVDVVPSLVTRLRPLLCFRHDVVIQEELFGSEMFFISEGSLLCKLAYRRTDQKTDQIDLHELTTGDYFAEYAVILDQAKHPASVVAEDSCDLHVLSRANFLEFGQEYPLVYGKLISLCKERYFNLSRSIIAKRQEHLMKLNVLEWEKKKAAERGEDPDELTITPYKSEKELSYIPESNRGGMTTLAQRLKQHRVLKRKDDTHCTPPPDDDLLHFVQKRAHTVQNKRSSLRKITDISKYRLFSPQQATLQRHLSLVNVQSRRPSQTSLQIAESKSMSQEEAKMPTQSYRFSRSRKRSISENSMNEASENMAVQPETHSFHRSKTNNAAFINKAKIGCSSEPKESERENTIPFSPQSRTRPSPLHLPTASHSFFKLPAKRPSIVQFRTKPTQESPSQHSSEEHLLLVEQSVGSPLSPQKLLLSKIKSLGSMPKNLEKHLEHDSSATSQKDMSSAENSIIAYPSSRCKTAPDFPVAAKRTSMTLRMPHTSSLSRFGSQWLLGSYPSSNHLHALSGQRSGLEQLKEQDAPDEVKEFRSKLPFWILVKIHAWKNRAQLQVAVNHIEVVEKRHHEKYSISQKHPSCHDMMRKNSGPNFTPEVGVQYVPESMHKEVQNAMNQFQKQLSALQKDQNETKLDIKHLQVEVAELKGEMSNSTNLLSTISQQLSEIKSQMESHNNYQPEDSTNESLTRPISGNRKVKQQKLLFSFRANPFSTQGQPHPSVTIEACRDEKNSSI